MSHIEPKEICEIVTVDDDSDFKQFAQNSPKGLAIVPESYGESQQLLLKADAGDFAKWLTAHHPEITLSLPEHRQRLVLRSGDYWFPLAFLASNIALPVYLHLVGSYLYEKSKGLLKGERARVHLSAEYEDKATGLVKRFNFEGDTDSLQKTIKKFDLNEFLNE